MGTRPFAPAPRPPVLPQKDSRPTAAVITPIRGPAMQYFPSLRSLFGGRPNRRRPATHLTIAPRGPRLSVQLLEDRAVPSATLPDVDLTTRGAFGAINGALFCQSDAHPTGSGTIN